MSRHLMHLRSIYLAQLAAVWVLSLANAGILSQCIGIESAMDFEAEILDDLGPLYDRAPLTLTSGERTEILGPFFRFERADTETSWAVPPLLSYRTDPVTEFTEFEILYPILSYDRFGSAYRAHFFQLFSISGGETISERNQKRITLFPFYFQQRSLVSEQNYTAFVPIYGNLKNRLLRDEIHFILFPAYSKTRKKDVVTYNFLYPVFHWREGERLQGWQVWPFFGTEQKEITSKTNNFDEVVTIGGHRKLVVLWPLYLSSKTGLGTENPQEQVALLPLFSFQRSPARESSSYLWPLGFTYTVDREKKYREWSLPWPLIVFTRGEGKTVSRIWPIFSRAKNPMLESNFYLWPIFKYNRALAEPLDRKRTRILLFLYSDLVERNTATGTALRRTDLWPLFTQRTDHDGNQRLQILSILEPFIPHNKSIERTYSPVWSIWRSEMNARTGGSSQSLLWNLYRHERTQDSKKLSILFGLFRYQSSPQGARWRILYIPFGKASTQAPVTSDEMPR